MTTAELIAEIHRISNLKKGDIAKVVSLFIEEMKSSLHAGESVKLRGFGTLYIKKLGARTYFGGKRVAGPRGTVRFQSSRGAPWKSSGSSTKKK